MVVDMKPATLEELKRDFRRKLKREFKREGSRKADRRSYALLGLVSSAFSFGVFKALPLNIFFHL